MALKDKNKKKLLETSKSEGNEDTSLYSKSMHTTSKKLYNEYEYEYFKKNKTIHSYPMRYKHIVVPE